MPIFDSQTADNPSTRVRVATFNVSMEGTNYGVTGASGQGRLAQVLSTGVESQIRNIAAIITLTRPDIILLNEFDYIEDPQQGVRLFVDNYLHNNHRGAGAIDYPYYYYAPVNTGLPSPFDLDKDGVFSATGNDAWGFGHYPGQYGMVILSRFPIHTDRVRTFQYFRWAQLPGATPPLNPDGSLFYDEQTWTALRLSSKSHWDVPVEVDGVLIHLLASHPTPPVFDGAENRNGLRNRDEIRFWTHYITPGLSGSFRDDSGTLGGLSADARFVILGDLNASAVEGDGLREGIRELLQHPAVQGDILPQSQGGVANSPDTPFAASHTATWRMRADYVIPSKAGLQVLDQGVFWPQEGEPLSELMQERASSSDHRLVWVDLRISPVP